MSGNLHFVIQAGLIIIQFLVPAFAPFTKEQDAAIAGCIAAIQGLLAKVAWDKDPNKPTDPPAAPKPNVQGLS